MIPADIDLDALPKSPKIDEANYGWTGKLGSFPCLLIGDLDLRWDGEKKTMLFDTRKWGDVRWSGAQRGRSDRFMAATRAMGDHLLVYVYADVGTELTAKGEHMARRGGRTFVGLFKVDEFGSGGFLAHPVRRAI